MPDAKQRFVAQPEWFFSFLLSKCSDMMPFVEEECVHACAMLDPSGDPSAVVVRIGLVCVVCGVCNGRR